MRLSDKEKEKLLKSEKYRDEVLNQIKTETVKQEFRARVKAVLNLALVISAFLTGMVISAFMQKRAILIVAPFAVAVIVIPLLYAAYRWAKYTR